MRNIAFWLAKLLFSYHNMAGPCRRLGVVKKDQPSIMIESMEGNYYALPLVNKVQQSGLLPLLPPGSTEKIKEEAEVCKHGPSDVLPEQVSS